MADYSSAVPLSSSPGYDTEFDSLDYDYNNDQEQHSDHHQDTPHPADLEDLEDLDTQPLSESDSDGELFVPAHRRSASPASVITLSASEPDNNLDAEPIEQQLQSRGLYPLYAEIDLISSTDSGGEEEGDGEQNYPAFPPRNPDFDFFDGLSVLPDHNELDSEAYDELFGDDFDAIDDDDFDDDNFDEAEADVDSDPQRLSPLHHHHHHHHHFHPPAPPSIHPDRLPPIVLGVNPLQQFGSQLSFPPPHLRSPFGPTNDTMDRAGRARNAGHAQQRDELVGVEMDRRENAGGNGSGRSIRGRSLQHQPPQANVIDLTGDDGDVEIVGASQNARRQQSQRRDNAPRLNRSDSSYMGNAPVIDISSDSEDDARRNRASAGGAAAPPPRHHHHHHHHHHHPRHRAVVDRRSTPRRDPPQPGNRFFGQQVADFLGNFPLGNLIGIGGRVRDPDIVVVDRPMDGQSHNNVAPFPALPFQLNYAHHPFQHHGGPAGGPASPPKPKHEPPPAAKEGFTRDTGEDQILICPSCEEELAYDPDDEDENGPPVKKQRTKKDKAEHHFWAVKECGHVYCRKCYDNRRPAAKSQVKVGFKPSREKVKSILCAVDGCNSDVTNKPAWVGLFL